MNLPTETDPFESMSERNEIAEKDRNDGKKHFDTQTKLSRERLDQDGKETGQHSDIDKVFNFEDLKVKFASKLKGTEEFLQNPLNLPSHVKFPSKFRESAKKLYVSSRDNNKLPKTVRLYRERHLKNQRQEKIVEKNDRYELYEEAKHLEHLNPASRPRSNSLETDNEILEVRSDSDERLPHGQYLQDRSVDFLFRPYGMSAIFTVILCIFYSGMTRTDESLFCSIRMAVISCSVLFLLIGILLLPSGPFLKPHPAVWRLVLAMSILYLMMLTFCFFLTVNQVQEILKFQFGEEILETASENLAKEQYATNCNDISPQKLWMAIDRYAFAHFFGWMTKAILLRSYGICWLISVTWEITEHTFTHIIENLTECWWDSWLLDVAICNGCGIHIGINIAKWLEMRTYKWESIKTKDKFSEKLVRVALACTPSTWFKVRWINPKSSPNRVIKIWFLVMMFLVTELNAFFFKHFVNYKSSHPINWGRIVFICMMAAPAVKQYYIFTTDMQAKNMGSQCWIFVAIIVMETMVNVKFGWTHFGKTKISYIVIWLIFAAIGCAICLYFMAAWSELTTFMFNDESEKEKQVLANSPEALRRPESIKLTNSNHTLRDDDTSDNETSDGYLPSTLRKRFFSKVKDFNEKLGQLVATPSNSDTRVKRKTLGSLFDDENLTGGNSPTSVEHEPNSPVSNAFSPMEQLSPRSEGEHQHDGQSSDEAFLDTEKKLFINDKVNYLMKKE